MRKNEVQTVLDHYTLRRAVSSMPSPPYPARTESWGAMFHFWGVPGCYSSPKGPLSWHDFYYFPHLSSTLKYSTTPSLLTILKSTYSKVYNPWDKKLVKNIKTSSIQRKTFLPRYTLDWTVFVSRSRKDRPSWNWPRTKTIALQVDCVSIPG
jgi:hypothetical protein